MTKRLLVCDLDNTLYDWVGYFVPAFYAMVDESVNLLECDRERLLDDLRTVHRRHRDAEHPFALLETTTVRKKFPNWSRAEIAKALDPAFHAFNSARRQNLKLYPGVLSTLNTLSDAGVALIAHTESKLYAAVERMSRLGIDRYFRHIYCRERPLTSHPDEAAEARWLERYPIDKAVELSHHQRKPDPRVLLEICGRENVKTDDTAYVGDSITRDVLLAKGAGTFAIWAKYGTSHQAGLYEQLVRVTHWSRQDVKREERLRNLAIGTNADLILDNRFDELLPALLGPDFLPV